MNSHNFWIREIVGPQDPAWERAIQLYQTSFPASERISPDILLLTVQQRAQGKEQRKQSAHFLVAQLANEVIGLTYCRYFEHASEGEPIHLGYLLYLAIDERYRGLGFGAHLYQALTATLAADAVQRGGTLSGVIYEVERPELAANEQEQLIRQRRIAFYERFGARVLQGIDYVQPAVSSDQNPVPLFLMYHPLARDFSSQQLCEWFYLLAFGIRNS